MNKLEILVGDTQDEVYTNFISIEKEPNKKFSFSLKTKDSSVVGYVDLTDEEYDVFETVFSRLAKNVKRID